MKKRQQKKNLKKQAAWLLRDEGFLKSTSLVYEALSEEDKQVAGLVPQDIDSMLIDSIYKQNLLDFNN